MPGARRCGQEVEGRVNLTVVLSLLLIALGAAAIDPYAPARRGRRARPPARSAADRRRARHASTSPGGRSDGRASSGLERVLGPTALAAVAYGEVGSSLYFALGIVALYALGLTPLVLLVVGALFLLVAALLRGGRGCDPGDRRRRHVRQARVQRPARLRDGLGAVPRLPDRRRARGPLHAALHRHRRSAGTAITHRPWDATVGVLVDPRPGGEPARPPHADLPRRRSSSPGSRWRRTSC